MATTAASISRAVARKLRRGPPVRLVPEKLESCQQLYSLHFSTSASSISSVPPPSSSQSQEKQSIWSKIFLFAPGAITFGLGTWQIFRRQDKIEMLDYRQNRLGKEPIEFKSMPPGVESLNSLEFRRMICKGVFDDNRSIYVGPRSRSISGVTENGYYLITPLMPITGNPESVQVPILVNRGWVPRSWRHKLLENPQEQSVNTVLASVQQCTGNSWWNFWSKKPIINEGAVQAVTPTEVIGVIRGSENPSIFVPANDPSSSQWFYVDVPSIARFCGLPENTLYIEDINENANLSRPYPVPKDASTLIRSSVMPQDHLNYTLTWYSLSAAVTFMAFKRLRQKMSKR